MADDFKIPTNPVTAATWLIEQTNGLFEESGHNSGAANLFFTLAYQSVKQSLSNDDKRALFVLSPSQDLEAAQPQWYIEQEQADSE